jgi:uncharacterized membrane protein YiaA
MNASRQPTGFGQPVRPVIRALAWVILVCGVLALVSIGLFEILWCAREKSFFESVFNFGLVAVVTAHSARIAITGRAARGWLPWQ